MALTESKELGHLFGRCTGSHLTKSKFTEAEIIPEL
jgi:hypothetical protein